MGIYSARGLDGRHCGSTADHDPALALALGGGLLGQGNGQDAVRRLGSDGALVDALQGEAALNAAAATLVDDVVLALLAGDAAIVSADGQHIVLHGDGDVVQLDAGQLRGEDVGVLRLAHIHREAHGRTVMRAVGRHGAAGMHHAVHHHFGTEGAVHHGIHHISVSSCLSVDGVALRLSFFLSFLHHDHMITQRSKIVNSQSRSNCK